MREAIDYSGDPISEAIRILEDAATLRAARTRTGTTMPPDNDDEAETKRSENASSEESF